MATGKKGVDDALVIARARGLSATAAAKVAGCSERTARRRLEDPAFSARVDQARTQLLSEAIGRLSGLGGAAGVVLGQLLAKSEKSSVRLWASRAVMEFLFKGVELDALARQIEDLQRQIEEMKHASQPAPPVGYTPGPARQPPPADSGADPGRGGLAGPTADGDDD